MACVVSKNRTGKYVLGGCTVARHQRHTPEQDEYIEHVVLRKRLYVYVRMPDCGSALQTHQQQNYCKRHGYADWFAVKPVVVFAIYTDEYDAEQPQSPHYSAEIVDALERDIWTLAELAAHAEINQRENKYERANGYAVHGLPVEGVNAVSVQR